MHGRCRSPPWLGRENGPTPQRRSHRRPQPCTTCVASSGAPRSSHLPLGHARPIRDPHALAIAARRSCDVGLNGTSLPVNTMKAGMLSLKQHLVLIVAENHQNVEVRGLDLLAQQREALLVAGVALAPYIDVDLLSQVLAFAQLLELLERIDVAAERVRGFLRSSFARRSQSSGLVASRGLWEQPMPKTISAICLPHCVRIGAKIVTRIVVTAFRRAAAAASASP